MEFIEIDSTRTGNAADSGQFVLTACNAYDDLLAACKLALHNSERFGSGSDTEAETEGALRAAIAKAEQEEI